VTFWQRGETHSIDWGRAATLLTTVPDGKTLVRVHFQWGFWGTTLSDDPTASAATDVAAFGIVSQTVAHGTTPPSPILDPGDAAAPTERWLYWEARFPIVMGGRQGSPGLTQWRDSGQGGPLSTKGQVTASGGSGLGLNIWGSFDTAAIWPASGRSQFWVWWSALYQ
jgi:hypothetical protein